MDVTANRPRRPTVGKIAATVGALSAFSLAGCAEGRPGSPTESGERAEPTRGAVGTTARPDDPGAGTGGDEPAGGGAEATDVACDDEALAALEDERRELQDQLAEIEFELSQLRTGAKATEYLLDQLDTGFPEQVLERGKAVGLATRPSVVTLEIFEGGFQTGHATAWFVDDGYLFTNAHNVAPSGPESEFRGVTQDGDRFDVEVVELYQDMLPDVALLRTEYTDGTPLPMTSVAGLEAGQPLVQVGNPDEVGFWIISMGRFIDGLSTTTYGGTEYTALRSVVPGRAGVSGSPVLTLDGEVVGMTHGGRPVTFRELGAPPPVAPDIVFDGPIGDVAVSMHDGSDILEPTLEDWR